MSAQRSGRGLTTATRLLEAPESVLQVVEREMGSRPTSCKLVTRLLGPHPRRAYRVGLPDGSVVKARLFSSDTRAAEVAQFMRVLAGRHVPRVLAQDGPILLLEWVDGMTLSADGLAPELYRLAGSLLAWLHSRPVTGEDTARSRLARTDAKVRTDVSLLRQWQVLSAAESERLTARLHGLRPRDGGLCLAHGDFCGENLVLTAEGDLYSVDNEALSLDFPDMDLARAILRWGLSGADREVFLSGYESERCLESYRRYEHYWMLVSLTRSVRYRYRCREADYTQELALLRELLQGKHDAGCRRGSA